MADLIQIPCELNVVVAQNESLYVYPIIEGTDVSIDPKGNSGSNAQSFVNNLGAIAFNRFIKGISSGGTQNDNEHCMSVSSILSRHNTEINLINDVKSEYSGWF